MLQYKNILVTGGAGFIGSNFIDYLDQKQYRGKISIVDSLTYAGDMKNLPSFFDCGFDYSFHHVDIACMTELGQVFENDKFDAVINFAAESHVDNSILGPAEFVRTNITGTANLLQLAKEHGVNRFLQVSTDEVYGSLSYTDEPSREITRLDPSSPYSASKAAADHLVNSYHRTFGMETIVTRCSNNYGPKQYPEKLIPLMIKKALNNEPLTVYGTGENIRDWIHVSDHCNGIWKALNEGKGGEIYNFGGNNQITNLTIVKKILSYLGKDESLITYVTDRLGHDLRYDINFEKAHEELNWKPLKVDFEDVMNETIQWYVDKYRSK